MATTMRPGPEAVERTARCVHCGSEFQQVRLWEYPREIWMPVTCAKCDGGNVVADSMPADPEQVRRDRRLRLLNIPAGFELATLETFTVQPDDSVVEANRRWKMTLARRFVEVFRDPPAAALVIVFLGGHATGKTHLAVGIGRELAIEQNVDARYVRFPDVVRELRAESTGYVEAADREIQVLQRYRTVDLLILDDVSSDVTAFLGNVAVHLLDIVADRVATKRPTIVITRDDLVGLEQFLGPTITAQVIGHRGVWSFGNDPFPTQS